MSSCSQHNDYLLSMREIIEIKSDVSRTDVPKQRLHVLDQNLKAVKEIDTNINSTVYLKRLGDSDYFYAKDDETADEAFYKVNDDYSFTLVDRKQVPTDIVAKLSEHTKDNVSINYRDGRPESGVIELRIDKKVLASIPLKTKYSWPYFHLFNNGESVVIYGEGGDENNDLYVIKDLSNPIVQALPDFVVRHGSVVGDLKSSVFYAMAPDNYIARVDMSTGSTNKKFAKVPVGDSKLRFSYLPEVNLVIYQAESPRTKDGKKTYPVVLFDGTTGATKLSISGVEEDRGLQRYVKAKGNDLIVMGDKVYDLSSGKQKASIPEYARGDTYASDGTFYGAIGTEKKPLSFIRFQHIDLPSGKVLAEVELNGAATPDMYPEGARQVFFWKDKLLVLSGTEVMFMDHEHHRLF